MKTHLTVSLLIVCLSVASSDVAAQEAKTLYGVVESVDGNNITVNHRRKSRTFTINDKTQIHYVSLLKAKEEIEPSLFVRAGVDSQGQGDQLWATLPIAKAKVTPSGGMRNMTPAALHKMADSNGGGELSYVEYASAIYRLPKHGPLGFGKADKDKSGTLNLKEFAPRLEGVKWWRISRKTSGQWHAETDANYDGVFSKQDFVTFIGSTAHLDTFFQQADKDRSGDVSVADLASFIDSILR